MKKLHEIRVSEEILALIQREAEIRKIKISQVVRDALEKYFPNVSIVPQCAKCTAQIGTGVMKKMSKYEKDVLRYEGLYQKTVIVDPPEGHTCNLAKCEFCNCNMTEDSVADLRDSTAGIIGGGEYEVCFACAKKYEIKSWTRLGAVQGEKNYNIRRY